MAHTSVQIRHGTVLSEHLYVSCLIWTLVCAMSYLNTCMCHVLSEHLYVSCLIWTVVCVMTYNKNTDNHCGGELDTNCQHQWLATGQWFSPGTPVPSTNKTDRHDIHMYVSCLIWTLVCAMSYLNTCMCHVLSEHLLFHLHQHPP
jgi:hypothetical protein